MTVLNSTITLFFVFVISVSCNNITVSNKTPTIKDTLYIKSSGKTSIETDAETSISKNITLNLRGNTKDSNHQVFNYTLAVTGRSDYSKHYHFDREVKDYTITMDPFFTIDKEGQDIESPEITGYIQIMDSLVFKVDKVLKPFIEGLEEDYFNHHLQFEDGKIVCLDCS